MTAGADGSDTPDELELLRLQAQAIGMPGARTPSSVGITLTTAEEIIARATAKDRTAADEALTAPPSPIPIPSARRKMIVRVGALAAAIVGIAAVTFAPWNRNLASAATPPILTYEFANARNIAYAPGKDARPDLLELADIAATRPQKTTSGSTQFLLTDNWFATLEGKTDTELIPKQRATWLRSDGSLQIRETSGSPLSPDGRGLDRKPNPRDLRVDDETYPPDGTDPQFVGKLGSDPTQVRTALLEAGQCADRNQGRARASCLYRQITGLYEQYVIPPATAAAFWRILADEPAMRSLGSVTDRAGRAGVGVSFIPQDSPEFRRVLIISPTTGQLLGTEDILIKDDRAAGINAPAIYAFSAILDSRFTRDRGPTS